MKHRDLWAGVRGLVLMMVFAASTTLMLSVVTDAQNRDMGKSGGRTAQPAPRREGQVSPPVTPAKRESVRMDRQNPPQQKMDRTALQRAPQRVDTIQNQRQRVDRTPRQDQTQQRVDRTPRPPNPRIGGLRQETPVRPGENFQNKQRPRFQAHRIFTHTQEGRRYDNGIVLRPGTSIREDWQRHYFPRGRFHYPYYWPSYNSVTVYQSPFGFYFGVCAPFILRAHTHHVPPVVVYVDIPVYSGDTCRGYEPIRREDNFSNLDYLMQREPGLASAVDDLREAFARGNIDSLVTLTDPNTKIAVFLKGKYEYSLDSNDYLDMTRDAFQTTQTISFDMTRIHERAAGVYVVSGEHTYVDPSGRARKVYVSFVIEEIRGVWTLTQVGTAPDRIQEW